MRMLLIKILFHRFDGVMSFKVLNEYTFKFIIFNMNYKINQLKKGIQVSLLATTKFAK